MWQSANKIMKISSQNIAFCISLCYHRAKREALRLHRLSFRLYSLAALGASRSGFFMLEIVIRIHLSVIVTLILTASFLQIHLDLLKFSSAARLLFSWHLYYITYQSQEQVFLSFFIPPFSAFPLCCFCTCFRSIMSV